MLRQATKELEAAASPTARLDAEVLLAHATGLDRLSLLADAQLLVTPEQSSTFASHIEQRLQGCPVAYITGEAEFWSLTFEVTPDVLIPRPDSEILVQALLDEAPDQQGFALVDLGTGSGCLALSLLSERPGWQAIGVDISHKALAVAAANADRLGLADRFADVEGNMKEWSALEREVDAIISNPPYIPSADIKTLDRTVREFEPTGALDGGEDGLDFYRAIVARAPGNLKAHGLLGLECGHDQSERIAAMLESAFDHIKVYADLAGKNRALTARLRPKG